MSENQLLGLVMVGLLLLAVAGLGWLASRLASDREEDEA
jgi:hypothetical protein